MAGTDTLPGAGSILTPFAFLSRRRTVPIAFVGEPGPDSAQLEQILTVATRVPDHGKLAPWRFILWEGDARIAVSAALTQLRQRHQPPPSPKELAEERVRFSRVPLVIGLVSRAAPHPKATEWEQQLSAGAVGMNLLHAANALGFSGQWLTDWPVYNEEAGRLLGLKPGERFAGFFHIGTPKVPPQERWRPKVAELATKWSPPAG
jgi:nitroreductase